MQNLLTTSATATLAPAASVSHPDYCKVSNTISLPLLPSPFPQSILSTAARTILIKENHIMSFLRSKLCDDFHFIQDESQSPFNSPCDLLACCPPPPLPPLPPAHSSPPGNTGETFQPQDSCDGCFLLQRLYLLPADSPLANASSKYLFKCHLPRETYSGHPIFD